MDVGLDTCGGCNLIRKNSLPPGAKIFPWYNPPHVHAAQGKRLEILGVVSLFLMAAGANFDTTFNVLVVSELVVPALLGTHWINSNVLRIEPITKERVLETSSDVPVTVPFAESLGNTVVRVAQSIAVPAFSETIMPVRTNRSGLSLIRTVYRSSHDYVHAKNGIMDLTPAGETLQCLVVNFSDSPLKLRKNQVVGVAEGQDITICTPLGSGAETDQLEWELH
jgi:hypothetical protein